MVNQTEIDVHVTPYDCCTCPDTIWISRFSNHRTLGANLIRDNNSIERKIEDFLTPRNETLLQFGSIYLPSNSLPPFRSPFEDVFKVFLSFLK